MPDRSTLTYTDSDGVERDARASLMLGFDCAPAPRDLEMVHGPWDELTARLMIILNRSNVARSMRPEGSTLVPAIGLPVHGPALPTSSFLCGWPEDFRYVGPWLNRSGLRLDGPGPYPPKSVPQPADLARPTTR
jgi:hypothetical protein